jgi:hypothetical protein
LVTGQVKKLLNQVCVLLQGGVETANWE